MTSDPVDTDVRTLQQLVDDVSDLLSAPAVLEDLGFALVAYGSQNPEGVDQVRAATILRKSATAQVRSYFLEHGIASASGPVRIPADTARRIAARICIPARSGGRTHGYLWVVEPESGVDARTLSLAEPLAARAGAVLAARAGACDERTALVEQMLGTDAGAQLRAWGRLVDLGALTAGEPVVVAVIRDPAGSTHRNVLSVPGVVGEDRAGAELALRRVARHLGAGSVAGISDSCPPAAGTGPRRTGQDGTDIAPQPLLTALRQAQTAALIAAARPQLGPVLSWDRLGFYRVAAQGPDALRALIAGGPADRLRARADPDLMRTALVWLDQGGNAARTAAALSVHRQTLYYRLERIGQVAGVDLGDGEARLNLHIGLALAEVLARLEGPA